MAMDFTKSSQGIEQSSGEFVPITVGSRYFTALPGFEHIDNRAPCLSERRVALNKLGILAGCVAAVTASAVAGALATDPDSTYYRTLDKPSWQPPPPVYGIVWSKR